MVNSCWHVVNSDLSYKYFDVPYHIHAEMVPEFISKFKMKNELGVLKLLLATVGQAAN